jgi:uncharacterized protein
MTQNHKEENKLDKKVNIVKFPKNTTKFYLLDQKQDWVKELLLELNEKAQEHSQEFYLENSHLNIQLTLTKSYNKEFGDVLFCKGSVKSLFTTQCVRTLQEMQDSLDFSFMSCFVDKSLKNNEDLLEHMEVYEDQNIYDAYFQEKGFADIYEMIHEQIYLNINQYPILDPDSPLPWATDGPKIKQ